MSQVTTFYSYKGGSGRSMTMANVAWALAMSGERVLTIDWDLEAPGIHRYFHPFLEDPDQRRSPGLIDRVWDFVSDMTAEDRGKRDPFRLADCDDIVQYLDIPAVRPGGCLHFLGAGKQDEHYSRKIGGLDWRDFYDRFSGKSFLEHLIKWARSKYTHILIDSRTGVADTAGICTAQLPDAVVMCFVYNRQSIEGTAAVARSMFEARAGLDLPRLHTFVLPCRVEERGTVDAARRYSAQQLAPVLGREAARFEIDLRRDEVRHHAWCAFEEKLAIFEDVPGERGSLLDSMHDLARRVARNRKSIRAVPVDREILARYWRRAAFADPRLAELELLSDQPLPSRVSRIVQWIEEADDEDRSDWLIGLCEAAVELGSASEEALSLSMRSFLGERSIAIAQYVYQANPEQYGTRFANILMVRSAQYQRDGQDAAAVSLLERSLEILANDTSPLARWRRARGLEKLAELRLNKDDLAGAIRDQDAAVELYLRTEDRHRIGYDMELPLALATLSNLYADGERSSEALDAARMSLNLLESISPTVRDRNTNGVMSILLNWVNTTSRFAPEMAEEVLDKARYIADRILGATEMGKNAGARLDISFAQLMLRQGKYAEAVNVLDRLEKMAENLDHSAVASVKIPALIGQNRPDEAIDYLIRGINVGRLPVSMAGAEFVKNAAEAAGRSNDILKLVVSQLQIGENWVEALSKVVNSTQENRSKTSRTKRDDD